MELLFGKDQTEAFQLILAFTRSPILPLAVFLEHHTVVECLYRINFAMQVCAFLQGLKPNKRKDVGVSNSAVIHLKWCCSICKNRTQQQSQHDHIDQFIVVFSTQEKDVFEPQASLEGKRPHQVCFTVMKSAIIVVYGSMCCNVSWCLAEFDALHRQRFAGGGGEGARRGEDEVHV